MLKRFYELRNEIADFMQIKNKPLSVLNDLKWMCDLAFLVDLTGYLIDLNLKIQKQGHLDPGEEGSDSYETSREAALAPTGRAERHHADLKE
ncbi:General transcription factor II-I repeat domain-containing protein 2B [Eumeta japonica]|uniref:General transcription factor II-I repeat domain-containing protein 2B n=1 Tax=Eumeta variegata TaxID=151549 RepID=A0A4C1W125_EUMVA|nr:General transcription factor II-I repeat domain-containing protein 2B [Eumeta japonica]